LTGQTTYNVDVRRADQLSAFDLYALLKLRVDVFVVEQECPYPELDGKDFDALHMRLLDDGDLIAAARIFAPEITATEARIGRVVVSPSHRRKRLGDAVMREAVGYCAREYSGSPIILSAQSHLKAFYASHGFEIVSDEYLEDGIPHVDMRRSK
jgi:ElaA protein